MIRVAASDAGGVLLSNPERDFTGPFRRGRGPDGGRAVTDDDIPPFLRRQVLPLTHALSLQQRWTWMTRLLGSWALIGHSASDDAAGRLLVVPKAGVPRPRP